MPYPFDDDQNEAGAEADSERERKFLAMRVGLRNARPVLGRGGLSEEQPPQSVSDTNDELIRRAGGMHGSDISRNRVPDAPGNALPPAPPGASILGMSSQPEGPATTRYEELLRKGPPQYHGFNKFLDILGNATREGRAIETGTGMGSLGYQSRLGRAANDAQSELSLQKEGEAARFSTPEKRQAYMQGNPSLFSSVTDFQKNDFVLSGKFPQREPGAEKPESLDQEIADAAATAQRDGRDPNSDPKVLQLLDVKQRGQRDPQQKLTPQEQAYQDYIKQGLTPAQAYEKVREQAPKPSKTLMLVPQPDGSSKAVEVTPGTVVPKGAETPPEFGKANQPTADEQRRADLARNMNENLDQLEEILNRRPNLFGWFSGRMTEAQGAIGTSDPDIAALKTIKEQMGMAMVGAHAMRNAQHVEAAGNAIVNSYHNSAGAVKNAIAKARQSLQTFISDAQKGTGGAVTSQRGGTSGGETGGAVRFSDGGRNFAIPADQVNEFLKDHPNARRQ